MPTPSQAEAYYRKIIQAKARAFAYLQELSDPAEETEENEWREFKGAGFIDAPLPAGDDVQKERRRRDALVKKYWSENLGAFANSGGGVLIWGIKAPGKFAAGTDLAKDASKLADRLQQLANQAVDPPVSGVEVRAVLARGARETASSCATFRRANSHLTELYGLSANTTCDFKTVIIQCLQRYFGECSIRELRR